MNVLLILNYQREIPPFMINIVKCAEEEFDRVEYITPVLYNNNSETIKSNKVNIREISNRNRFNEALRFPLYFLRGEVQKEIIRAIRERRIGKKFLKHLAEELYPSQLLYVNVRQLLKNKYINDKVYIFSCWFNCNAYAAARLKKNYPEICAVSLAHAFEVKPDRNLFVDLSFNIFKHQYLDKVSFISKKVLSEYLHAVNLNKIIKQKIDVCYLGSKKEKNIVNEVNSKEFNVCTCAGMTEIKRIELMLDALETWNSGEIIWTHIGDGPLWKEYKRRAKLIEKNNSLVTIRFMGKLTNKEVHEYYRNFSVDLFINTSRSEGLPVSIMEAMSYGIPVIATDVGGTSEIVTKDNGFLLKEKCTGEEVKKCIEGYKKMSSSKKLTYRKEALKTWETKFDGQKNIRVYFENLLCSDLGYG